ncbi:MAG TPA: hypothetical protein VHY58_18535 [Streptosporangiaceae bacterium]|nr:hypothetical protein [Streptosporangiaceae bacterium]
MSVDWVTVSSLATAGGTLVLAVATFGSIKSANRTARAAERALQIGLRPILMQSRRDDPPQKMMYGDEQWVKLPGGTAAAQIREVDGSERVYLGVSLRNAGSGLAIIHGWIFHAERPRGIEQYHPPLEQFRLNARDLYIPVNDTGFWQAAYRTADDADYAGALEAIKNRRSIGLDLLYGDHEGGQRVITRFSLTPRGEDTVTPADGDGLWVASAIRHWNVDRPDPRAQAESPVSPTHLQ